MGAHHSNVDPSLDRWGTRASGRKADFKSSGGHRKKFKAKPNPPHQLSISAVTHSSVSFSWLPPRTDHGHPVIAYTIEVCRPRHGKRWRVLTKNCQSTSFEAKHLESDTQYAFKVRAENIFGTGKPSAPSEIVTTKVFEMSSDLNCYFSPSASPASPTMLVNGSDLSLDDNKDFSDRGSGLNNNKNVLPSRQFPHGSQVYPTGMNIKRRHSFNVQLDGGVTSILNHSDVHLNSSFSSSTSTIINGANRSNSNGNGLDVISKSHSLSRGVGQRLSLQSGRKVSLSAFLPGAQAQSMNRLRESRSSLRSGSLTADCNGNLTKTALLSRDTSSGYIKRESLRNSLASSTSDVIGSLSSKEDHRKSRGSRSSLLSSQSDATVSNSHDGSRHSDYSSSMDNLDTTDFGDSQTSPSINISLYPTFETFARSADDLSNTPTNKNLNLTNMENGYETLDAMDEVSKLAMELRDIELTDEKLRSYQELDEKALMSYKPSQGLSLPPYHQSNVNYYESLDDPWEKSSPTSTVPDNIMAAPFCDDIKIALYAKNLTNDAINSFCTNDNIKINVTEGTNGHNFRSLRSVLQSDQTIVKPTRAIPEVVGMIVDDTGEARTLTRGKLTTIEDAEEEDDPVRVTTL